MRYSEVKQVACGDEPDIRMYADPCDMSWQLN